MSKDHECTRFTVSEEHIARVTSLRGVPDITLIVEWCVYCGEVGKVVAA